MPNAIETHALTKTFDGQPALREISLRVEEGTLFGLIGPDGAGKTTLIRLLASLLLPDAGRIEVLGYDARKDYTAIRRQIGYMPSRFSLYSELTVAENLRFSASLFGKRLDSHYELIRPVYEQLAPFSDRLAGKLSGGMKQKLALSCALVHRPRLLLLDEPTRGVDPVSRFEFWERLKDLGREGITTVVSTPYMEEAGRCRQIALLQQGRLLRVDSPQGLQRGFSRRLFGLRAGRPYPLLQALREWKPAASAYTFGDTIHFATREPLDAPGLCRAMAARGFPDVQAERIEPTVEDCFMELAGSAGEPTQTMP